jgi:hypothetical protein
MTEFIRMRPDTECEIRQASEIGNLPGYIERRLRDAARVHDCMATGAGCLLIKTSSVVHSGDDTRRETENQDALLEVARAQAKKPVVRREREPDAAERWLIENDPTHKPKRGRDDATSIPPPLNNAKPSDEWPGKRSGVWQQIEIGAALEISDDDGDRGAERIASTADFDHGAHYRPDRARPSASDISRADEASLWPGLCIPKEKRVLRRVVNMVTQTDRHDDGKYRYAFSEIATEIGCDKDAIKPWFKQGISIIADALKAQLTKHSEVKSMDTRIHPDRLLTPREVVQALYEHFVIKTSESSLSTWRQRGCGPAFYKVTGPVFYKWQDIVFWVNERTKPQTCTRQLAIELAA